MVCLSLSVKQLLENKGIKPREEHLDILENRWEGMQSLRGNLENANIDDANMSLRNIPGGDHVE
ncbi:hypothetical protein [Lentibacillus juripiscarius]|uniref:Uncharacterized protein n=1 Tax=Lentibacillus juripiscarius TaxID=257446 RepID=A0ABW5V5E3_9BACI